MAYYLIPRWHTLYPHFLKYNSPADQLFRNLYNCSKRNLPIQQICKLYRNGKAPFSPFFTNTRTQKRMLGKEDLPHQHLTPFTSKFSFSEQFSILHPHPLVPSPLPENLNNILLSYPLNTLIQISSHPPLPSFTIHIGMGRLAPCKSIFYIIIIIIYHYYITP